MRYRRDRIARLGIRPVSIEALSAQVQTITEAVKKAGAQEVSTNVGPVFASSQGLSITVTGSFPAIPFERVLSATQSIMSSLQNMASVNLVSINAAYGLRDCDAAETQVRRNAIGDARRRAEAIAQAQNLRLGSVIHDSESLTPGCIQIPAQFANGELEVTGSPTVLVTVSENVTYGILPK